MTFFSMVLRGLIRRPIRTGLTLAGISIGIAAVVALVGISRGFETSWTKGMKTRGTDIVVNSMGSSITPKPFPAEVAGSIQNVPGVASVCSLLVDFMSVETADMMIVSARQWGGFTWANLKVVEGRLPNGPDEHAVVLGRSAAEVLKKKIGAPLQLENEELTVVGIVDGGAVVENGSIILSLSLLQKITNSEGRINVVDVQARPGMSDEEIKKLCEAINAVVPEARAVAAGENIRNSQAFRIVNAMSWGTSFLAILVGVLGVTNTMLMTVYERKQEICILLAIGWRRSRIIRMVLWESALLGLFGGIGGVVIGLIGARFLEKAPAIRGLLAPDLSPGLMATAVVIAVIVGVVSGLYPAWRSSRIPPGMALNG